LIITYLKLKNWCQHRDLSVEFSPRSNGIIGTNGKGKSNLIKAVRVALTGRTDSDDSFSDDISDGESSSFIELGFLHDGVPGTIKRRLYRTASNTADLVWGDVKVSGITQVNSQLESMTGASAESMEKYTFIAQDKLRAVLFDTPSKRTENMIAMIPDISKSRVLRERLDRFISTLPVIVLPFNEENLITENCSVDLQLKTERESERNGKLILSALGDCSTEKGIVAAYNAEKASAAQAGSLAVDFTTLQAAIDVKERSIQDLETKLRSIPKLEKGFIPEPEAFKCQQFRTFNFAAVAKAKDIVDHITDAVLEAHENRVVADQEMLTQVQTYLTTLQTNKAVLQASVTRLKSEAEKLSKVSSDGSVCPLCKSEVPSRLFEDMRIAALNDVDDAVAELQGVIEQEKVLLGSILEAKNALDVSKKCLQVLKTDKSTAEATLQFTVIPEYNEEQTVAAEEQLAIHKLRTETELSLTAARTQLEALSGKRSVLLDRMSVLRGTSNPISEEDYMRAMSSISFYDDTAAKVRVSSAMIVRLEERLVQIKSSMDQVKRAKDNQAGVEELKKKLTMVRDLLHRDRLPKAALRYYLDSLQERLSSYLSRFGASFSVTIDEDFGITFIKDGRPPSHIRRLSGGEKSVVSTSLHMAVADMFNGAVRLLVLDEPSQNMDEEFVTMLTSIIETASSGEDGKQLIVVTHHANEMLGAFHNVIKL